MKIYKYICLKDAITSITQGRLKLSNPKSFNDPFDTKVQRDPEDIKITKEIEIQSRKTTHLMECLNLPYVKEALKRSPLFEKTKREFFEYVKKIENDPFYSEPFKYESLYKFLNLDESHFEKLAIEEANKLEEKIKKETDEIIDGALVTCFSRKYDSLLMWSHYADKHKGVCIEYDRPLSNDFIDMEYSDIRPKIKFESLTRYESAVSIVGREYDQEIQRKVQLDCMLPFITKSKEWKYEQEVRCLITKNGQNINLIKEGNDYFYKMPKPIKIYIGCRCRGNELTKLEKQVAKLGIKIKFLKDDKDTYSLVEK